MLSNCTENQKASDFFQKVKSFFQKVSDTFLNLSSNSIMALQLFNTKKKNDNGDNKKVCSNALHT